MAATKNGLLPHHTFSGPINSTHPHINCHFASSAFDTSLIGRSVAINASYPLSNSVSNTAECIDKSPDTPPIHSKMDSFSSDPSPLISNETCVNGPSKSMGGFTSSLMNSRYFGSDSRNNNLDSGLQISSHVDMSTTEEARVPINGEPTPIVASNQSIAAGKPISEPPASSSRTDSCVSSRKNSLNSTTNAVSLIKLGDYMYSTEPWKDDSLSMSSSFSSSMSSLPSPPSPVSPPSFRPQSLPQSADIPPSGGETLSASLPDPGFLTTYCSNSCGGSPRKRIKDTEGFIRRAACICVNEAETQVLLVSSKSSSEVWLVPGGGLEEGEDAEHAAIREAYEEAGVRGTILGYLGLFESRPELSATGKKHRTAVYVVRVDSEETEFPEATTIGRQRKWMSVDDALAQLSRHRPRQSVYLQLLRATRLRNVDQDSACVTKKVTEATVNNKQETGVNKCVPDNITTGKQVTDQVIDVVAPLQEGNTYLNDKIVKAEVDVVLKREEVKSEPIEVLNSTNEKQNNDGLNIKKIEENNGSPVHEYNSVEVIKRSESGAFNLKNAIFESLALTSKVSSTSSSCESLIVERKNSVDFKSDSNSTLAEVENNCSDMEPSEDCSLKASHIESNGSICDILESPESVPPTSSL